MMNDRIFPTDRILLLDGAMGTMIQLRGLGEEDFRGTLLVSHPQPLAGNNDVLCLTRPDVIHDITRLYIEAGADIVSTNTFGANSISQADYGTSSLARDMAREGARIARRAADAAGRPVLVAGSMGPTNKTASMSPDMADPGLRAVTYDQLVEAYAGQILGLTEGGADVLLFETVFDTLNLKAGLEAARLVAESTGRTIPVMLSVTIAGRDGRTFSGQTLEAFIASVSHAPIASLGLNCSLGAADLLPWVERLAAISPWPVTCHPNAGLPDETGRYNDSPESMAAVIASMASRSLVNAVGGCCGTTPAHIAAMAAAVKGFKPRSAGAIPEPQMCLSGLEALPVTPGGGFVCVGERCNVAGSRKFLRLIKEGAYAQALEIARKQVDDGARIIDINMDDGLLEARSEMTRFINLLSAEPAIARVPVMVDSSSWPVIEDALKCLQGRSVVNSISLKEGEQVFVSRARRIRQLGAAVVVMAFDEQGQADTFERKIQVCSRAYSLLVDKAGFAPCDIIFDPNILSIATGIPEHDRYGLDFIDAVGWIKTHLPGAKVSGGVSNLSFAFRGNTPLREAMHSVFLHHAVARGMDMAILNPAAAVDYGSIEPGLRSLLEDVILCRRPGAADELAALAAEQARLAAQAKEASAKGSTAPDTLTGTTAAPSWRSLPVAGRLVHALVEGIETHLQADLDEALSQGLPPVAIIDGPLMEGMNKVGTLFGQGRMFLPQVVKTARTMKTAVALLQPAIDAQAPSTGSSDAPGAKAPGQAGHILFATVKGDVHDIGKNIVSIVLACNGYRVTDLGVMVPPETIVEQARALRPDIICLSGLITPSLGEMAAVARALHQGGIDTPIMVGGATTSALHTALKIAPEYPGGVVIHVRDASQNPLLAARLLNPAARTAYIDSVKLEQETLRRDYAAAHTPLVPLAQARAEASSHRDALTPRTAPAPAAPGLSVLDIPVGMLAPYINHRALLAAWKLPATLAMAFHVHGCKACRESFAASSPQPEAARQALKLADDTQALLKEWARQGATARATVWLGGAYSDGDDIVLTPAPGGEVRIPTLRRQQPIPAGQPLAGLCPSLSDWLAPQGADDHAGAFAVSFVPPAAVKATKGKASGRTRAAAGDDDPYTSLLAQTLSHRIAEAASQWLHERVRTSLWGYAPDSADNTDAAPGSAAPAPLPEGIRPAIGYPSLPDQTLTHTLAPLLDMQAIGITLTDNGAMHPSASVCGLYIAHPQATYFTLGPIAPDQLADYAARRSMPLDRLKAILNR